MIFLFIKTFFYLTINKHMQSFRELGTEVIDDSHYQSTMLQKMDLDDKI